MGRVASTVVALAAALACAAPATAVGRTPVARFDLTPTEISQPGYDFSGPRLGGDRVVWGRLRTDTGFDIEAAEPGGPTKLITRLPGASAYSATNVSQGLFLSASPAFLAYTHSVDELDGHYSRPILREAQAGPVDGPYQPVCDLVTCGGVCGAVAHTSAPLVRGNALTVFVDECGTRSAIRDLTRGPETARTLDTRPLDVAGRYALLRADTNGLVVYDWVEGAEVYRVAATGGLLDATGRVVVFGDGTLTWYSPAEPFAHPVPAPSVPNWRPFRFAAGRIAYTRLVSRMTEIGSVDLTGARRVAATLTDDYFYPGPALLGDVDFDGRRLAWATRICEHATVYVDDVTDPESPFTAAPGSCPYIGVISNGAILGTPGRIPVFLYCPKRSRNCRGVVSATAYVRRTAGRFGPYRLEDRVINLRPASGGTLSLRTPLRLRAAVARFGQVRLLLTVRGFGETTARGAITVLAARRGRSRRAG